MASVLKVDKLDPQSGTALEIGTSGDTLNVPSGVTLDINSGATLDATGATVTGAIGKIGQVVFANATAELDLQTTTYTDSGVTVNITPSATSSSVLVLFNIQARTPILYGEDAGYGIKLFRDASEIYADGSSSSNYWKFTGHTSSEHHIWAGKSSWSYLDTGISTTSQVTYKVQVGGVDTTQVLFQQGSNPSEITVMEILA